ncbi:hypothetical protein ACKWTF_014353 [Chironomus riparius]
MSCLKLINLGLLVLAVCQVLLANASPRKTTSSEFGPSVVKNLRKFESKRGPKLIKNFDDVKSDDVDNDTKWLDELLENDKTLESDDDDTKDESIDYDYAEKEEYPSDDKDEIEVNNVDDAENDDDQEIEAPRLRFMEPSVVARDWKLNKVNKNRRHKRWAPTNTQNNQRAHWIRVGTQNEPCLNYPFCNKQRKGKVQPKKPCLNYPFCNKQ